MINNKDIEIHMEDYFHDLETDTIIPPELDKKILDNAISAFEQAKKKTCTESLREAPRRQSRKLGWIHLAASLVVLIGIILGFHLSNGPNVVWAKVAEKVAQMQSCEVRGTTYTYYHYDLAVRSTWTFTAYISKDKGVRIDDISYHQPGSAEKKQYFQSSAGEPIIILNHTNQRCIKRLPASEKTALTITSLLYPEKMIEKFLAGDYTKLGSRNINRKEVEGIEVKGALPDSGKNITGTSRLWVSTETNLPILLESEAIHYNLVPFRITYYKGEREFRWDIDFKNSWFKPIIPEHYKQETIDPKDIKR